MRTNVVYYNGRDYDLDGEIQDLEASAGRVDESLPIDELMGVEATARKAYYRSFNEILPSEFQLESAGVQPAAERGEQSDFVWELAGVRQLCVGDSGDCT